METTQGLTFLKELTSQHIVSIVGSSQVVAREDAMPGVNDSGTG